MKNEIFILFYWLNFRRLFSAWKIFFGFFLSHMNLVYGWVFAGTHVYVMSESLSVPTSMKCLVQGDWGVEMEWGGGGIKWYWLFIPPGFWTVTDCIFLAGTGDGRIELAGASGQRCWDKHHLCGEVEGILWDTDWGKLHTLLLNILQSLSLPGVFPFLPSPQIC